MSKNKLNAMSKKNLFRLAAKAMDKYSKAIEMDFPENYIAQLNSEQNALYQVINSRGMITEFEDYMMCLA